MIPFLDLKAQYAVIREEIQQAVNGVLDSAQYVLGPEVEAFEREFAAYCGASHAVAVNSGTSALHLALLAAGVQPGDEVITTPFTFVATVAAICYVGARPVFVDIEPDTYLMDVSRLEGAVTARTKAIVPVHLHGQMAGMHPVLALASRHGLAVIEDAAQAHGAAYQGSRAGSMGDFGCFSFYPGKNLGACGEAGLITTGSASHARTLRMMRDWGQERKYHHVLRGFNYRMDGLQGAILRVKLRRLEQWTEARRSHAQHYRDLLSVSSVACPRAREDSRHVYHVFAVRTADRDRLQSRLTAAGIQTAIHYPFPVHLVEAYRDLGYREGAFPVAEAVAREVLSLPMYPELTPEQVASVAGAIRDG